MLLCVCYGKDDAAVDNSAAGKKKKTLDHLVHNLSNKLYFCAILLVFLLLWNNSGEYSNSTDPVLLTVIVWFTLQAEVTV